MSVEISIPFRLDADGRIAVESNTERQIRQHVMSLINTEPGERVVLGGYGLPLSDLLFEDGDDSMVADLGDKILAAFAAWEPGITLRNISHPDRAEHDGLAEVSVEYMRTDAPETPVEGNSTNLAVIRAGAQVSEVIRG